MLAKIGNWTNNLKTKRNHTTYLLHSSCTYLLMYFIQSPLNSKLSNSSVVDTRLENRFTGQEEITQHLKLVLLFALTALHTQGYQSAGGRTVVRFTKKIVQKF